MTIFSISNEFGSLQSCSPLYTGGGGGAVGAGIEVPWGTLKEGGGLPMDEDRLLSVQVLRLC